MPRRPPAAPTPRSRFVALALLAVLTTGFFLPAAVAAHGAVPHDPPTFASLILGWRFDPLIAVALAAAAIAWLVLVRRVGRAHPGNPIPARRTAAFMGGLAAIAIALLSGIEQYDTTLFSIHMVQHLLLILIAPPLLAYAAPVTQVLRVASPAWRRRLVGVLHSGPISALSHPVVAWLTFTLVMWISHFSPLFDAALENRIVHDAEHAAYLAAGLLFWWPVVGADPAPRRLSYPVRALYVLLQMPPSSFLGMLITFATSPLYPHYATLGAPYGIDALADQELAGGIMWVGGDVVLITAVLLIVAAWMRHEERDTTAAERRVDAERARLRERADVLALRRAGPDGQAGERPAGMGDSSSSR
ncbi:MAG TPA: cytochrome c oxidase assembly protein [Candidatus Limnocylindrales bacterium]|nr:cytochrome c oxidase assembly protein [Candidatus Limnocylindrales bacterium]